MPFFTTDLKVIGVAPLFKHGVLRTPSSLSTWKPCKVNIFCSIDIPLYQHIANLVGNKNLVLCCLYPPSMLSMVAHMQETNLLCRSS